MPSAADKPKILIVEDENIVARDIALQLQELGYQPVGITDLAEEAIVLAGQLRPDLVLMDIQLAGEMDGISAAQAIRTQYGLPVVFLTAFSSDDTLARAKLAEPFGYILKPFSERELRTVLEMALYKFQTENQLRISAAFNRCILDSVSAEIAVLDSAGIIIAINQAWHRFSIENRSAQDEHWQGIGSHYECLTPCESGMSFNQDDVSSARAGIQAVLARSLPYFGLEYPCHIDGKQRWFSLSVTPFGNDGQGVVVSHTNITERLQSEMELRKLSLVVEQSPGAVIITDMDGNIEYVNPAFLRNSGYSRAEVLGKRPWMQPQLYTSMRAAVTQGAYWSGELYNRRKDGSTYIEHAIVTPLRQPSGEITHYVSVQEDITAKKRLADELERHRYHLEELVEIRTRELAIARQQADSANLAKSTFLANMSHEIRTPMNAIIGMNFLLRQSNINPEQAARLDKISSASEHLLAIIEDILDLSKIEAGQLQLENTDFDLLALLDNVHSIISIAARNKGLEIDMDAHSVPRFLSGDPTRLRQCLLNYAGNAVKFTERGRISIRAELQQEASGGSADDTALFLRFSVKDGGIGISPEKISRLFQPFEQADLSTTRKYGGTGLGLAITSRLAVLMGGEVGVESKPGVGSNFWFSARLQRADKAISDVAPGAQVNAQEELLRHYSGSRILLAEDDMFNREIALELLSDCGLIVDTAETGLEALNKAQELSYALVLMDMQMPLMDGLDATRAIRKLPGWDDTPIIAMTANAFNEDRHACEQAGMDDFLSKPVDPPVLYSMIFKWLKLSPK
jgi:PAS domain S-box-containing protein